MNHILIPSLRKEKSNTKSTFLQKMEKKLKRKRELGGLGLKMILYSDNIFPLSLQTTERFSYDTLLLFPKSFEVLQLGVMHNTQNQRESLPTPLELKFEELHMKLSAGKNKYKKLQGHK